MVPRYHKYFNVSLTYSALQLYTSIYNGRKEGEHCAKTKTGTLYTRYFCGVPITLRIQVQLIYYITVNALGFRQLQQSFPQSLVKSTFSHSCASL